MMAWRYDAVSRTSLEAKYDMRALIVGGAGFVGLNIAARFSRDGYDVIAIDTAPPPPAAIAALGADAARIRFTQGDVTSPESVTTHISKGIDIMVYGAAITADAARDAAEPERLLAVNLGGLVPVLRAARDVGAGRIINLSSAAALGRAVAGPAPLAETLSPDPATLYAITKNASERVAARLAELWSLDVLSVRLSAVFGPFEYPTGVRDTLSPLGQIMIAASLGRQAILARPGERDWLYAPDVADAVACLAQASTPMHRLYNITTPDRYAALAWGEALSIHRPGFSCRLASSGEMPTIDLHAATDRPSLSPARMHDEFGWTAPHGCAASADAFDDWARRWGPALWRGL